MGGGVFPEFLPGLGSSRWFYTATEHTWDYSWSHSDLVVAVRWAELSLVPDEGVFLELR